MCELIFLTPTGLEGDEDPEIMDTGGDSDTCSREFGAQLVEASGYYSLRRTIDPKSRNRGMVRCLLRKKGDPYEPACRIRGCSRSDFSSIAKKRLWTIFNIPVALMIVLSYETHDTPACGTNPEELPESRVVGLARFPLYVFLGIFINVPKQLCIPRPEIRTRSLVNQNRRTASIRPSASSESGMLILL